MQGFKWLSAIQSRISAVQAGPLWKLGTILPHFLVSKARVKEEYAPQRIWEACLPFLFLGKFFKCTRKGIR